MMTDGATNNNPDKRVTLGEFIRQYRLKRGLSQTELASITHLSGSVVSQIENGVTPNPTILTLKALAKAWKPQKDFWNFISKL
jgi:transcriptional regulator with XRE-family HTH domain